MLRSISDFFKGSERSVSVKKNAAILLLMKGLNIFISLLFVPLTINYLNTEKYGIWLTISSIASWFSFFNFGLSNGLRNLFTEAKAKGEYKLIKIYVSTTYFLLGAIFIPLIVILLLLGRFVDLASLLSLPAEMGSELLETFEIVLTLFCLQMIFSNIVTILTADLQPAKASAIDTVGQLLAFGGVCLLVYALPPSLPTLAGVVTSARTIVLFIFTFYYFKKDFARFRPSLRFIDLKIGKSILNVGAKFFIIQIAVIILYQSSNVLISHVSGPNDVTYYNIVYKYFYVCTLVMNVLITPIWSAFTDAYVKKDYDWMNMAYTKMKMLFYAFAALLVVMLIASDWIISFWIRETMNIPFDLKIAVFVYILSTLWMSIHTPIINGVGTIRLQMYLSLFASVLNIPLSLFLGYRYGASGIVMSTVFFNLITSVLSKIQVDKLLKMDMTGVWGK